MIKNNVKLWPSDSNGFIIQKGSEDLSLHIALQKGDALQFVLDPNGDNGQDATYMIATVTYQEADPIEELVISGLIHWQHRLEND